MSNIDALNDHLKRLLNQEQYTIATTGTEKIGYPRVRGPAGSGKTLALAARAAVLACEDEYKRIFICSANKTLGNFIKHIAEPFISEEDFSKITFLHFHRWCEEVCEQTGYKNDYEQYKSSYSSPKAWNNYIPKLVSNIYSDPSTTSTRPRYDAILIDEGHDFHTSWVQTLRKAVKKEGEMLFVTDQTQDVHETAHSWTDEGMEGCGFPGRWRELEKSYRLSPRMTLILRDFLDQFHFEGEINRPPKEAQPVTEEMLDSFRWVQVPPSKSPMDACIKEVENLHGNPDIHTVYFLTNKISSGKSVVNGLKQRGISDIIHTYDRNWQKANAEKINFKPGCADICATTVHSFKGWEASHLVVHVESINTDRHKKLFYTALSRLKKHPQGTKLTVVSSCPELEQFGRKHFL